MAKHREIYLIRHGETAWSQSGQHTGTTDIPLTENGVNQAKSLEKRLKGLHFDHILSSPLKRAHDTCLLSGLSGSMTTSDDLLEWEYGDYEGLTTDQIHLIVPDWNVFSHGAPNGESTKDVIKRADRLIQELKKMSGRIALFSSGHFSRAFTARFLGFPIEMGRHLIFSTAAVSILSYEHDIPALLLWNDTSHHD